MPQIVHWFRVSHDINQDAQLWALTDQFRRRYGDKTLRVYLEAMSIADRNEGLIGPDIDTVARAISYKCRLRVDSTKCVLSAMKDRSLLELSAGLRDPKYAKYHKTRKSINSLQTDRHYSYKNKNNKSNKNYSSAVPELSGTTAHDFPEPISWIPEFLKSQTWINGAVGLDEPAWWSALYTQVQGFDQEILASEFAGMQRWCLQNSNRRPTSKGFRRFIGGWIERSYEKERTRK